MMARTAVDASLRSFSRAEILEPCKCSRSLEDSRVGLPYHVTRPHGEQAPAGGSSTTSSLLPLANNGQHNALCIVNGKLATLRV